MKVLACPDNCRSSSKGRRHRGRVVSAPRPQSQHRHTLGHGHQLLGSDAQRRHLGPQRAVRTLRGYPLRRAVHVRRHHWEGPHQQGAVELPPRDPGVAVGDAEDWAMPGVAVRRNPQRGPHRHHGAEQDVNHLRVQTAVRLPRHRAGLSGDSGQFQFLRSS